MVRIKILAIPYWASKFRQPSKSGNKNFIPEAKFLLFVPFIFLDIIYSWHCKCFGQEAKKEII